MLLTDRIKEKLKILYKNNPEIHIKVHKPGSKSPAELEEVNIVGIYKHIFTVEKKGEYLNKKYSFQYSDVITKYIFIAELAEDKDIYGYIGI